MGTHVTRGSESGSKPQTQTPRVLIFFLRKVQVRSLGNTDSVAHCCPVASEPLLELQPEVFEKQGRSIVSAFEPEVESL